MFTEATVNHSVASLALGIATCVIAVGLLKAKSSRNYDDILEVVLTKTAPNAASEQLKDCLTCERKLNGVNLVITKDPKVADYIFNGRSQRNYTRRPASIEGLKKLGMHNQGLIWNNNTNDWKKVRSVFQLSLNDANMEKAVDVIKKDAIGIVESSINDAGCVDMMSICRRLTFRATLSTFFGIESSDFVDAGIQEMVYIDAIINYFKAWEYFLLRPETHWESSLERKHSMAVKELQRHVKQMLESIAITRSSNASKRGLFIDQLREIHKHHNPDSLVQSALEMMIAGTDTSSVTAYYALLGISPNRTLQADIRQDILSRGASKSKLLRSIIDETLRFKPVGPVVLREAVQEDPSFPNGIKITKGTAILIHLADMNACENFWSNPKSFCPMRFLEGEQSFSDKFFPFGHGPKGCIGMHLGRREVTAILESIVLNYDMDIGTEDAHLGALETHWDIANQPENPTEIMLTKL